MAILNIVELLLAVAITILTQSLTDVGDYSVFVDKIREMHPNITLIEPNLVASGIASGKLSLQMMFYIAILAGKRYRLSEENELLVYC